MRMTYEQTIKTAIAIKETPNQTEQLVGILAIADYGDAKAIRDGRLEPLVEFAKWCRATDKGVNQ